MDRADLAVDLLADRARLSKRSAYSQSDAGASFLGSRDFPPSLVAASRKSDPKGILFGTGPVSSSAADREQLKRILDERVRGKKFLLCSGAADKLVPYRCSQPFLDWFLDAVDGWYADGKVSVENIQYPGIGHTFSAGMVADSLRFISNVVAAASIGREELKTSKI